MSKIIGVVGSRRRNTNADREKLLAAFDEIFEDGDTLVSGGCPTGADSWAEYLAKARGLTITIHYPDWVKFGKAAGFVRNGKIAESCDVLVAVVAGDRTGGTEDTIRKCEKMGKKVVLVV